MDFSRPNTRSITAVGVLILIVLAVTLFVSSIPQTSAAAVTCKWKHKVQQGETLTYIANLYQVGWEKIADANDLTPPYAIVVGQVLCIPEGTNPSLTKTPGTNASLQVSTGINKVLVSVENFAKKANYYVYIKIPASKLSPTLLSNPALRRIGYFKTNKEGDYTGWFHVPYYIPRSPQMTVCVKNVMTDRASCVIANDVYAYVAIVNGKCNPKVGR
jgi:LysM repeat protein